jgi:hypothetical protein
MIDSRATWLYLEVGGEADVRFERRRASAFKSPESLEKISMSKHRSPIIRNADAVFLGWQETPWGKPVALYNITAANHPSYGSTVLKESLRKFHLQVPPIPLRQRRAKSPHSRSAEHV